MIFHTSYGENIQKILEAYGSSPRHVMIDALEKLIKTAQDNVRQQIRNEVATTVCEGLHDGPGVGLKCLLCYQAEQTFKTQIEVEAEIAAPSE